MTFVQCQQRIEVAIALRWGDDADVAIGSNASTSATLEEQCGTITT
jgi:hypothetical protein